MRWEEGKQWHRGAEYGCVWRHAPGWGKTPCHYAMNSYAAAGRLDLYNRGHREAARALGYVEEEEEGRLRATGRIRQVVGEAARRRPEEEQRAFLMHYEGKFHGALHWLRQDARGWHYGYVVSAEQRPKHERHRGAQPTFQVKDEGRQGYGAWYPYHHEHHHLVPQGAVHEYLIGKDALAERRLRLVLATKWNINRGDNLVLLPKEVFVAEIVGLPAHCPWGLREHPEYSASMRDVLKGIRTALDAAMDAPGDCQEVLAELRQALEDASMFVLEQIRKMKPGRQLSAVNAKG